MKPSDLSDFEVSKLGLSRVMWHLIQNNIVTPTFFLLLVAIDYTYQLLLILALYSDVKSFSVDMSFMVHYLHLNNNNMSYTRMEIFIVFALLILVTFHHIVYYLRDSSKDEPQSIIHKVFSGIYTLLRTVVFTLIIQIMCNIVTLYKSSDNMIVHIVSIAVMGLSFVLLMMQAFLSSAFFSIPLPNIYLPWSETSQTPFMLECIHKISLVLAFSFRENIIAMPLLVIFTALVVMYKCVYRTRQSYFFNQVIFVVYTSIDLLMIHLLVFQQIASAIKNTHFLSIVLIVAPVVVIAGVYYLLKFRHSKYVSNFEQQHSDSIKLQTYLNLLCQLNSSSYSSQTGLFNIQRSHLLNCNKYSSVMERSIKSQKRYKGLPANNTLVYQPTLQNSNYKNSSFCFADETKNETNLNRKNQYLQSQTQSQENIQAHTTEDVSYINTTHIDRLVSQEGVWQSHSKSPVKMTSHLKKKGAKNIFQMDLGDQFKTAIQFTTPNIHKQPQQSMAKMHSQSHLQVVKHLFKYHLITDKSKDYRLQMLKIYFILRALKNPFLAHFLLLNLSEHMEQDNIILRNQKYLMKIYIDDLLSQKQATDQQALNLDIQNVLELNALLAKFDSALNSVADEVSQFWSNLLNEKDSLQIFDQGLQIAQSFKNVDILYDVIEKAQGEKKELKLYLQMAGFYKFVIFKKSEYEQELLKYRNASQTNKIGKREVESGVTFEKGMLIARMNLKHTMEINFINKPGCQLIEYDSDAALGLKINQIMPQLLSENHQAFIDRFLRRGKSYMINNKRHLFMKQKSGYVFPAQTYLFINYLNQKNMVFLFEYDKEFQPFMDAPPAFLLIDKHQQVLELSRSCLETCRLNYSLINKYENQITRKVALDDLFDLNTLESGEYEYEEQIHYANSKFDQYLEMTSDHDYEHEEFKTPYDLFKKNSASSIESRLKYMEDKEGAFMIKIMRHTFSDGLIEMHVVAIKCMTKASSSRFIMGSQLSKTEHSYYAQHAGRTSLSHQQQEEYEEEHITQSMSSASSTSMTNQFMNAYHIFTTQINSNGLPQTLKFILQLAIGLFLIITITSVVSLTLTLTNFKAVTNGIDVNDHTLVRLTNLGTIRILTKLMINIANGYVANGSSYLRDRFGFYKATMFDNINQFQEYQVYLEKMNVEVPENLKYTNITSYAQNRSTYSYLMLSQQAIRLYIDNGYDILSNIQTFGQSALQGNSTVQKFDLPPQYQAQTLSITQRQLFFQMVNGRSQLYDTLEDFTTDFTNEKLSQVTAKKKISSITSFVCVGVIFLCGILIIPLFGRIQNRIMYLMQIFFSVKPEVKSSMIAKVAKYRGAFEKKETYVSVPSQYQNNPMDSTHSQKDIQQFHRKLQSTRKINEIIIEFQTPDDMKQTEIYERKSPLPTPRQNLRQKRSSKRLKDMKSGEIQSIDDDEESNTDNQSVQLGESNAQIMQPHMFTGSQSYIKEFQQSIKRTKINQSIMIFLLICALSAYFFGTYALTNSSFSLLSQNFSDMKIIYLRKACAENAMGAVGDKIALNRTNYVRNNTIDSTTYFLNKCTQLENDYQQTFIQSFPVYLQKSKDLFAKLEGPDFCDEMYGTPPPLLRTAYDVYRLNVSMCKTGFNQFGSDGITPIYAYMYKNARQMLINYETALKNGRVTTAYIKSVIATTANYQGLMQLYLTETSDTLLMKIKDSITEYFQQTSNKFIIVFSVFMFCCIIFLIVFLLKTFKRLKKEMILSNKMLLMIDIEEVSEEEKKFISKFLKSY